MNDVSYLRIHNYTIYFLQHSTLHMNRICSFFSWRQPSRSYRVFTCKLEIFQFSFSVSITICIFWNDCGQHINDNDEVDVTTMKLISILIQRLCILIWTSCAFHCTSYILRKFEYVQIMCSVKTTFNQSRLFNWPNIAHTVVNTCWIDYNFSLSESHSSAKSFTFYGTRWTKWTIEKVFSL